MAGHLTLDGVIHNGPYAVRHYLPTPYYASNGLPYKYNPETNTLEEIPKKF